MGAMLFRSRLDLRVAYQSHWIARGSPFVEVEMKLVFFSKCLPSDGHRRMCESHRRLEAAFACAVAQKGACAQSFSWSFMLHDNPIPQTLRSE